MSAAVERGRRFAPRFATPGRGTEEDNGNDYRGAAARLIAPSRARHGRHREAYINRSGAYARRGNVDHLRRAETEKGFELESAGGSGACSSAGWRTGRKAGPIAAFGRFRPCRRDRPQECQVRSQCVAACGRDAVKWTQDQPSETSIMIALRGLFGTYHARRPRLSR